MTFVPNFFVPLSKQHICSMPKTLTLQLGASAPVIPTPHPAPYSRLWKLSLSCTYGQLFSARAYNLEALFVEKAWVLFYVLKRLEMVAVPHYTNCDYDNNLILILNSLAHFDHTFLTAYFIASLTLEICATSKLLHLYQPNNSINFAHNNRWWEAIKLGTPNRP